NSEEQPNEQREDNNGNQTKQNDSTQDMEAPGESFSTKTFSDYSSQNQIGPRVGRQVATPQVSSKGPAIISFPVKDTAPTDIGVVIPSGSYVKAKMMTGVEAPEGKNYPVLLQLDYAFVGPNRTKVDLTGCFGISKAQGDL